MNLISDLVRVAKPLSTTLPALAALFLLTGFAVTASAEEPVLRAAEKTDEYYIDNAVLLEKCSHISFLEEDDQDQVPEDLQDDLITPGKYQRKLVILAVNELPEMICKSVGKIAIYDRSESGAGGGVIYAKVKGSHPDLINVFTNGDKFSEEGISPTAQAVYLNNEYYSRLQVSYAEWPFIMKTIIHEAAHCAVYLLQRQTDGTESSGASPWQQDTQQLAVETVKNTGLQEGFIEAWQRNHESFVELNFAQAYSEGVVDDMTSIPVQGYFSAYGQKDPWEDIAEFIALLSLNDSGIKSLAFADELGYDNVQRIEGRPTVPESAESSASGRVLRNKLSAWNDPCQPLKNIPSVGVKSEWAAVYAKLMFLIDVGFIDEQSYTGCAADSGKPNLRFNYDRTDNGIHRVDYESGEYMYSHTDIALGFPVSSSEVQVFTLLGEGVINTDDGGAHDMQMRLEMHFSPKPRLPRGVYYIPENLVQCPWGNNPEAWVLTTGVRPAPWTFRLKVPDAPSMGFCATGGYLLVTRSTRNFIEASMIINTVLKKVGRMPIPERPDFKAFIRWQR